MHRLGQKGLLSPQKDLFPRKVKMCVCLYVCVSVSVCLCLDNQISSIGKKSVIKSGQ